MMKLLHCKICGNEYKSKCPNTLYCSEECRNKGTHKNRKKKISKNNFKRSSQDYLIYERDNFTCIYCGKNSIEDSIKLTFDHVIPISRGGSNLVPNIITSCDICNKSKNNKILNDELLQKVLTTIEQRNNKIKSKLKQIDSYLVFKYKSRLKYR